MSKHKANQAVLGVYVGTDTIEGVLIRRTADHVEVVQRLVRQRVSKGEMAMKGDLALALPGLKTADDSDYTLEVGDGSASSPSLLPSELAQLGGKGKGKDAAKARGAAAAARSFAPQLKEMLQECHALGYTEPDVAFCIAPPDVAYVELPAPPEEPKAGGGKSRTSKGSKGEASGPTPAERKKLLAAIPDHYSAPVDEERIAFLPLGYDRLRYLAIVADPAEPVGSTLTALREQDSVFAPAGRILDAEASLYAALLARSLNPSDGERTAIIRVGTNDTLVLFLDGSRLLHLERLRSLTAYDAPETICSRVLLQQDEKRIGELQNVFVLNAGRGEQLLNSFRTYYPDAAVETMQRALVEGGVRIPEDDEALLKAGSVPALAVALRQLQSWDVEPSVNLLPRPLQRRKKAIGFSWHTALALLLLVLVCAGTVWRYQAKEAEIETIREEHRLNPVPIPAISPALLQARVDSLNQAYATYTRALDVLDSLLVGSDKWVTTFEGLSRATAAEPDTWVNTFQPQSDIAATVVGHSLSRLAIVDLSRRLNGAIVQLTYQDIGERRVYNYEMTMPLSNEMPRAALYLRNVAPNGPTPAGAVEVHPGAHAH